MKVLMALAIALPVSAAGLRDQVREYRVAHETQITNELVGFLSIPNLARDRENIERNATAIEAMLRLRNIPAKLLRIEGAPPIVVGDLAKPGAKRTIAFYAHYDGQPVNVSLWDTAPWQPVIKGDRI